MNAEAAVAAFLDEHPELEAEQTAPSTWFVMLHGEHKRTIGVWLELSEHTLAVRSFFLRAPDENEAELYAFLLRRHLRSYVLRFALHPDGDLLLMGALPREAVTAAELDRLLGQVLTVADETFDHSLRLGFAAYIEREQRWRERVGAPRNPIT